MFLHSKLAGSRTIKKSRSIFKVGNLSKDEVEEYSQSNLGWTSELLREAEIQANAIALVAHGSPGFAVEELERLGPNIMAMAFRYNNATRVINDCTLYIPKIEEIKISCDMVPVVPASNQVDSASALCVAIACSNPIVVSYLLGHPDIEPDTRCKIGAHPLLVCYLKDDITTFKRIAGHAKCKEKNPHVSLSPAGVSLLSFLLEEKDERAVPFIKIMEEFAPVKPSAIDQGEVLQMTSNDLPDTAPLRDIRKYQAEEPKEEMFEPQTYSRDVVCVLL